MLKLNIYNFLTVEGKLFFLEKRLFLESHFKKQIVTKKFENLKK